ncbi:NUDIX hydrolase [Frigidibacter sp. ROC022]|uniref:NUDIX hydrolase n=1 Tax=Frigidibacter sp. ROC022 TaxID=2971796 RepID=UPI00215A3500|nr:NUDIX hydrolase [Frigidibacter sp. ROC022]MCR8724453.1 NUDIX hydrolase [Frigidibacter sp. ROC022]
MRRYGETPRRGQVYHPRPGAYAVLLRGDRVLLTFQAEPDPEYQLPGGGIDPGEQPIAALHREVYEETGWTIGPPRHLGAWRRFTYMPEYDRWAEKICHVWLARPIRRLGPPTEPGHTALFLPAGLALEMLTHRAEADFLANLLS